MEERRKNKRTELNSYLLIKRMDGDDHTELRIRVADVSMDGVGFVCKEALGIGEVYESYLTIWTQEVIHAFLQIVRIELKGDEYSYGAIFIGMPKMDASRIAVYQTVKDNE